MSDTSFADIALGPLECAFSSLRPGKHIFIMKWLSNQINVGVVSSRRTTHTHKSDMCFHCPRCNHYQDDLDHAFCCPRASSTVSLHLDSLAEWFDKNSTHPDLAKGIIICTKKWLRRSREKPSHFLSSLTDTYIISTLSRQYCYGWIHFLNGIHTSAITSIQQTYLYSIRSRKSATLWHGRLICDIWNLTIKLYDQRLDTLDAISKELHDPTTPAFIEAQQVALAELSAGRGCVCILYHQYFTLTPNQLLSKDVHDLRRWLRTIRTERECTHDPLLRQDDFSPDGRYRSWLFQA